MVLTEKQRAEYRAAAEPIIKWLNDNCHPHTTITVDHTSAQLYEGVTNFHTEKHLKD